MSRENARCPYRLDTCVWELTLACTFSCAHCGSNAGRALPDELSLDEALGVACQLADMACRRVVLIGGEAFLFPGWQKVARLMVDGGVDVSVITNGSCFTDRSWREIEESGVRHIALSIDGCREAHDAQRQAGSFDAAIAGLRELKRRGYTATVVTTLTQANCAGLEALCAILEAEGADGWQLQLYAPIGGAGHGAGGCADANAADALRAPSGICRTPTPQQIRDIISFVVRTNERLAAAGSRMFVAAADNIGYFTADERRIRLLPGSCFPGCAAGLSVVGIDSCGNVTGCESLRDPRFIEGNLRQRTLRSIWEDESSFAYNRKFSPADLKGACASCDVAVCCAGGCRSMNFYRTGDSLHCVTCVRDAAR